MSFAGTGKTLRLSSVEFSVVNVQTERSLIVNTVSSIVSQPDAMFFAAIMNSFVPIVISASPTLTNPPVPMAERGAHDDKVLFRTLYSTPFWLKGISRSPERTPEEDPIQRPALWAVSPYKD
jgi:hypothetical protein